MSKPITQPRANTKRSVAYKGMSRLELAKARQHAEAIPNRKEAAGRLRAIKVAEDHICAAREEAAQWISAPRVSNAKASAVLVLLDDTFDARWRVLFGYTESPFRTELNRRVGLAGDRQRELNTIAREEFAAWTSTLARRVVNGRGAAGSDRAAAHRIAGELIDGWRALAARECPAMLLPELEPSGRRRASFQKKLRDAIYQATRKHREERIGEGDRSRRVLVPRSRLPATMAGALAVVRAVLAEPPGIQT